MVGSRRKYTNEQITTAVRKLFKDSLVQLIPIQLLRPIQQPRRPSNTHNLRNIVRDLNEGFLAMEAILVWKDSAVYPVVYGNQRYGAAQQKGTIRFIPCYVLDGMENPEVADLCYANLIASVFGPQPRKRSFVSKVIEIRCIISWVLDANSASVIGSLSPNEVEDEVARLYGGKDSIAYQRHWASEVGIRTLRIFVFIAKSCMFHRLENEVDSLERHCQGTDFQVSVTALQKVMILESHERGKGKLVLRRFLSTLEGEVQGKMSRLKLDANEESLYERISSGNRGTGASKGGVRKKRKTSESNKLVTEAISEMESGVKQIAKGLRTLEKASTPQQHLTALKDKIAEMNSIIAHIKAPDSTT